MKRSWIFACLMSGFISGLAAAAPEISPEEAASLVANKSAVLIDVREESELRASGLAEPARWLATSEINARSTVYHQFLNSLDPQKKLVIYCRSGRRADAAADHFISLGFDAWNMGGLDDWIAAGLPLRSFQDL